MTKSRLEAFSDGVIAILITIMVLELKVPHSPDLAALWNLAPTLGSYVLSFVFVGIYWNNHHHLLHSVKHINGKVLWANNHLLFWLSLVPFATAWMGETNFACLPITCYGAVLFMAAIAYTILIYALIGANGKRSELAIRLGSDLKGKISLVCYALAIALSSVANWVSLGLYVAVALMWLIPDRRFEKTPSPESDD